MLYSTAANWIQQKIDHFNHTYPVYGNLRNIDVYPLRKNLPSSQMDKRYFVKFAEIDEIRDETLLYRIKVEIELHFLIGKKPLENYRIAADEFLFNLASILQNDTISGLEYNEGSVLLTNIRNLKITKLNNFDPTGNYLVPNIEFELEAVIDEERR